MRTLGFSLAIALLGVTSTAHAHFDLITPPGIARATEKVGKGDPPCGPDTANPASPSMTYKAGDTITITINESTPHPGWYRVALAKSNRSELPKDPTPTPGHSVCGTVTGNQIIGLTPEAQPTMPVIMDGALFHTAAINGNQSFTVKLPADVSCTNCILEVEEFMSEHGFNGAAGCFYHHCASIAITGGSGGSDAGTTTTDAGSDKPGSAGTTGGGAAGTTGGAAGTTATGAAGTTAATAGTSGGAAGATATAGTSGGAAGTSASGAAGTSSAGTRGESGGGCSVAGASPYPGIGLVFVALAFGRGMRRRSKRS